MSQGWILLHRQIQDCWIWQDRPYSKGQAWVDLLLLANHRDVKIPIDGKPVEITRGQFHTSEVKLANRWGWDRRKVKRFLEVLESDRMLVKECSRNGTTITLVNYDNFQGDGTPDGTTHGTPNGTSDGTQTNNVKNVNNVKNNIFTPPTLEEVTKYCQERSNNVNPNNFIDFYSSKGWMIGKNKMKDWKAAVRTWEKSSKPKTSFTDPRYKEQYDNLFMN